MADMSRLDDLLARQKAMNDVAAGLVDERDPARIQQLVAELQRMGDELQAVAREIQAENEGSTANNYAEVVLTPEQRARVEQQTGVHLETVMLDDPSGVTTRLMPHTDPRLIELQALREAQRRKAAAEADAQLRSQLDESLAAIESQGTPAVLEQLEQLKQDPAFLGGLLQKK